MNDLQDEDDDSNDEADSSGGFETESLQNDDLSETIQCPKCGKPIYEGSEWCPHCGNYISLNEGAKRKSGWLVLGIVLCLLIILIEWVVRP